MKSRLPAILGIAALALLVPGCVTETPPKAAARAQAAAIPPRTPRPSPAQHLAALAPDADVRMLQLALQARQCAIAHGDAAARSRLAVIDYSLPSTQRRLWVFDVPQPRLLHHDYVAHGRNSGGNLASRFSNDEGSLESSLGLFRTAETYTGDNGYSLRMDGLEPGFNDHARERALVMHGAWYVDPQLARRQGRLGRSLGCPALQPRVAAAVIDDVSRGQLLFAYYPDPQWLAQSQYLNCSTGIAAAEPEQARIHATAN
jgi:hypothetical protein